MMDPRQFLTALWGENPPGMLNIFMLPDQKSYWYPDLEKVNRDMQQHLHEEVYTGVALAKKEGTRFNTRSRVKEVDAAAIPGVWSDIDVFHPSEKVHKDKILPGTVEQAQEVMAKLPHSPTLIVDSGHGLQYWWLLEEPWVFRDQGEWEQARRMTQWWHRITKELFQRHGLEHGLRLRPQPHHAAARDVQQQDSRGTQGGHGHQGRRPPLLTEPIHGSWCPRTSRHRPRRPRIGGAGGEGPPTTPPQRPPAAGWCWTPTRNPP